MFLWQNTFITHWITHYYQNFCPVICTFYLSGDHSLIYTVMTLTCNHLFMLCHGCKRLNLINNLQMHIPWKASTTALPRAFQRQAGQPCPWSCLGSLQSTSGTAKPALTNLADCRIVSPWVSILVQPGLRFKKPPFSSKVLKHKIQLILVYLLT